MNFGFGEQKAAEKLVWSLVDEVDGTGIERIIASQKESLGRYEKTNEMLANCSSLSSTRLENAKKELAWNTQLITDMKKDLDSIFRRIRVFKNNLSQLYPEAFSKENSEVAEAAEK